MEGYTLIKNTDLAELVEAVRRIEAKLEAQDEYLTTIEACERFKVSERTLYNRKKAGVLKAIQSGRVVRWPVSELTKNFKAL